MKKLIQFIAALFVAATFIACGGETDATADDALNALDSIANELDDNVAIDDEPIIEDVDVPADTSAEVDEVSDEEDTE